MRAIILAAGLAALMSSTAGASTLASCRGIADRDARLDCYDAIAVADSAPAGAVTGGHFDGAYAGASVHTGGASESPHSNAYGFGRLRLDSDAIGAFAGYNHSVGNIVLGIEASIRGDLSDREANSYDQSYITTFPQFSYYRGGGFDPARGTGTVFENRGPYTIGTGFSTYTDVREVAAPMLSARAGVGLGDFLLYGRGGIGASYMTSKTVNTNSQTICADTVMQIDYTPWDERGTYIECIDPETTSDSQTFKQNRLAPTFAAAIGAEYHHDRYFGRVEAEARYIHWGERFLSSGDSGTMRYQVGLGAGIRF